MRVLSALNHEGIEGYLEHLCLGLKIDKANSKNSLLEAAGNCVYELLIISKELPGSEEMDQVIGLLSSKEFNAPRIIFLYGEHDSKCDDFVRMLINYGVYDFYVGEEITSKDIEKLVFAPADKETAFGYFKSMYNNGKYFRYEENNAGKRSMIYDSAVMLNRSLWRAVKHRWKENAYLDKLVISVISNQSTGKSHTTWNLGYCLRKSGYKTSIFNIDRGYSANLYFDIDEQYYDLLDFMIQNNRHKDIIDSCCRKKNLNIITGKLGEEKEIAGEDFLKLLYSIRTKSDITIIDTRTGLSNLTRLAIKNSTYDLLIFDCDIMHYHMNMKMLEELKDDFIPEKTIAVINNTDIKASCNKFIYNELKSSGLPFKDIAFIGACGLDSCELMHTGTAPYKDSGEENKGFRADMDSLLDKLCRRQ